jgi:glycerophosphoryl diester phosphodiesterase
VSRPLPSASGRPLVIAHRGAKAYKPENTLAAYALAVEQGADMVEIDIHLARDRSMPISHDAILERFGREGEIADVSLDELRAMSRSAFEAKGSDKQYEEIPLLEEVLDQFGEVIPFNLEIKTMTEERPYPGLQKMILDQVVERGLLERTLFSSFSDKVLLELRKLQPEVRLGVLVDPRAPEGIFERAEACGAESINPHFANTDADLVDRAHQKGLAVYVYTVDDPWRMKELFGLGVDGLFSNVPDLLREVVASLPSAD